MSETRDTSDTRLRPALPFESLKQHMTRARNAWHAMRKRCLSPSSHAWHRYGGAGIRICPQWETFGQFLKDMGLPPTPGHWLGRKDVIGHYTPSNCLWTEPAAQQRRRKFCHQVHLKDGRVMTASEASRLPGMPGFWAVRNRLAQGFSLELPQPHRLYRTSRWINWQGETLPLPQWARRLGLRPQVLANRLRRMTLDAAMTPQVMREHRAIEWQGERLPLKVWASRLKLSTRTLRRRIASGMPLEQAMTPEPLKPIRRSFRESEPTTQE